MPSGDTFLAIDLGASSGRAIVGEFDDRRMTMHEVHRFPTPLIEDQEQLFWGIEELWEEVQRSLDEALRVAPEIRAVSIDSWAVDYVPLDMRGMALRRAYSYRDPRTKGRLERILQRIDSDSLYAVTGTQFLPFNTLSQVVADIEDEPEVVSRTAARLFIADYLLYRLSGVIAVERTMASTSQLYDVRSGTWSKELVHLVGDDWSRWPRIVDSGTILGRVRADLLPFGTKAPAVIASCSHDTAAAVAAAPATGDEPWAYISSGTWSLIGTELSAPILTPQARAAGFTNEVGLDGTIRFLKNRMGTWVLEECAREWDRGALTGDWTALMKEAVSAKPPGFVIDVNEASFGERGTMTAKIANACVAAGMPVPESRGALVRLVIESLAHSYRQIVAELGSLTGDDIQVLHVVGGGARNALLNQLTADACGCRLIAGPFEATALGNLLVQARTLGTLPDGLSIREAVRRSSDTKQYLPRNAMTRSTHQVASKALTDNLR
jgi:rhamnulokinase